MRSILRIALFSGIVLAPAVAARGQAFSSANFNYGFYGPFDGYSAIWAYPVGIGNGPSPYYSPIFNTMAASRPRPSLEPSPYARSPLEVIRSHLPDFGRHQVHLFHRPGQGRCDH